MDKYEKRNLAVRRVCIDLMIFIFITVSLYMIFTPLKPKVSEIKFPQSIPVRIYNNEPTKEIEKCINQIYNAKLNYKNSIDEKYTIENAINDAGASYWEIYLHLSGNGGIMPDDYSLYLIPYDIRGKIMDEQVLEHSSLTAFKAIDSISLKDKQIVYTYKKHAGGIIFGILVFSLIWIILVGLMVAPLIGLYYLICWIIDKKKRDKLQKCKKCQHYYGEVSKSFTYCDTCIYRNAFNNIPKINNFIPRSK